MWAPSQDQSSGVPLATSASFTKNFRSIQSLRAASANSAADTHIDTTKPTPKCLFTSPAIRHAADTAAATANSTVQCVADFAAYVQRPLAVGSADQEPGPFRKVRDSLSCVPFLAFAVIQRSKRDWAVFAAYLAATVALITAVGLVNTDSGWYGVVAVLLIALGTCAAIHACILFRPGRAQSLSVSAGRQRNQEAMQVARSRIERRNDARRVVQTNPVLARELRIGRPDLLRDYDDGGLVDANRVPGAVLAAELGLMPDEVTNVLAARAKLGRFASLDELCDVTGLSPRRVDELRDLMIFT